MKGSIVRRAAKRTSAMITPNSGAERQRAEPRIAGAAPATAASAAWPACPA